MAEADTEILGTLALNWLSSDFRARIIVTESLNLRWANESARKLIDDAPDVDIVGNALSFRRRTDEARATAYLTALDGAFATFALPIDAGAGHLLFRGKRMESGAACCVELAMDHVGHRPLLADFDTVFGLTASEASTASALFEGHSVAEVAQARRVSIDTVRTHVRGIYTKLGTASREQFFRRLHPFRIF